ncbi:TPA: restriction endonuclease subunit S [Yersinia enterocolitica]|nr:restriction endonuclease subunit S [Yersinia enterocolitica]HDL8570136.1 restriction endonuclease subunit S [Yersinia enterocolitica]HEB0980947.1 restriction endonuclease subunit S [Yersinia enterocolitica]HEB1853556.1 restriction endonuclease subunit S [Yersinia enterocolitica]
MTKYKAYPEYKDSGVEWLGEIPKHWDSKPLKFLCTCNDQVISDSTEKNYELEYVDIGSVSSSQGITKTENMIFSEAPSRARRLVQDGDVIISTVRTYLEAIAPIIAPPVNMVVSTGFAVIRPLPNLDKGFAAYCLRASGFIKEVVTRSVGVSYPAINASDLVNIPIPNCPLYEQSKIASFLDHETAKIDKLIEKQQQLIELLKEKRQAVISHAVTKGLNPDVPMKDSGVEWLGEVPEHWAVVPLKYLCKFSGGGTPTKDNLAYWQDGTIPWVSPKDMKSFWISETQDYVTEKAVNESSTNYVEEGSLLMVVRSGILQRTIPVAINTVKVTMNQDMKALRFNERVNVHYAIYFISGNINSLLLEWTKEGATVESIEHEYLANGFITVPPIDEQISIINNISEQMKRFQLLEANATSGIRLLQERRTALISAAVTGKIDVRDWVAPDTHEVEVLQEVTA